MNKIVLILIYSLLIFNNTSVLSQKYFSIGYKANGISFGNPSQFNGIKLNIIDLNAHTDLIGFNFTLLTNSDVRGASISILNRESNVDGLNFSLINHRSNIKGVNFSMINNRGSNLTGFSLSVINRHSRINGFSVALIGNNEVKGVTIGAFNRAPIETSGVQIGFINWNGGGKCKCCCYETVSGLQLGILNKTLRNNGVQFGIINYSTIGKGIQIGLINIRAKNPWYSKILPIVNFKMDSADEEKDYGGFL